MKIKKYISGVSILLCPKCNDYLEVRRHIHITQKQLNQPFYYAQWFYCNTEGCKVTTFMREEDRVMNKNGAAENYKTAAQTIQQMNDFREELDAKLKGLFE